MPVPAAGSTEGSVDTCAEMAYVDARAPVKVPSRFRILVWVPELAE